MKKSRRYLLGTLVTLLGLSVALVAINRILEDHIEPVALIRTAAGELAALRDFDRIEISGDFRVEIVYQPQHSVSFTPLSAEQGEFIATQADDLLIIRGGGNRRADDSALVRIGLPFLYRVRASLVPAISISGFTLQNLDVGLREVEEAELVGNEIEHIVFSAESVNTLRMRGNSFGRQQLDIQRGTRLLVE